MGPEFFQTMMGRKFYEADVPRLIKALEKIAVELEKFNAPQIICKDVKCEYDHLAEWTEGASVCEGCGKKLIGPDGE